MQNKKEEEQAKKLQTIENSTNSEASLKDKINIVTLKIKIYVYVLYVLINYN